MLCGLHYTCTAAHTLSRHRLHTDVMFDRPPKTELALKGVLQVLSCNAHDRVVSLALLSCRHSPLNLLQESYPDPWQHIICCVLCSRTSGSELIRTAIAAFFVALPTPTAVLAASGESAAAWQVHVSGGRVQCCTHSQAVGGLSAA
jgi:hypothetical protein